MPVDPLFIVLCLTITGKKKYIQILQFDINHGFTCQTSTFYNIKSADI